jgi:hypothetical protein
LVVAKLPNGKESPMSRRPKKEHSRQDRCTRRGRKHSRRHRRSSCRKFRHPLSLPPRLDCLAKSFSDAFTKPTWARFLLLCVGLIIATSRRTVSRVLCPIRPFLQGHYSDYHRVFSHRKWSPWPLAKVLAGMALALVPQGQRVFLCADDTVAQHRGEEVYAKGCHRDAVRSAKGRFVTKWGHKWVVLAVLVEMPFCKRPWALPLLCALYRTVKLDEQEKKPHKTPCTLARQMMAVLMHWFPRRQFVLLGDGGFASHDLANFARRHRRRLTLVARLRSDANLYSLPPRRVKGRKLPGPCETVAKAQSKRKIKVRWYGGSERELELLSGCGGWYNPRHGGRRSVIPLRWVYSKDSVGGREDYFYSTDPRLEPRQIVEWFAGRWSLEVTFREMRDHLGLESTRQRKDKSVLRMAPLLFGLYSVVAVLYAWLWQKKPRKAAAETQSPCYRKNQPTFSDAMAEARRMLWDKTLLLHMLGRQCVATLPRKARQALLEQLCTDS